MRLSLFGLCAVCLVSTGAGPDLIGGREIPLSSMPAIVYVKQGSSRCSATIIAKDVVLTAAHCVPDLGDIGPVSDEPVEVLAGEQRYSARCRQSPAWRTRRGDHDMALCKVDRDLPFPPAYISAVPVALKEKVLLTGYGCTQGPAGTGGNDGKLRVGEAEVIRLPAPGSLWFYTEGSVALCYGDSGSSAWSISKGRAYQVVGVNSRGNIRRLSLLTALYTAESLAFLRQFQAEQHVRICGVSSDC